MFNGRPKAREYIREHGGSFTWERLVWSASCETNYTKFLKTLAVIYYFLGVFKQIELGIQVEKVSK